MRFHWWHNLSLLYFLLPIHTNCVFSKLTFNPDIFSNHCSICNDLCNDFSEPFNNRVVSSAYWDILYSNLSTLMPLISLSFRIFIESISAHRINKYGEIGSPCLQPLWRINLSDKFPHWFTLEYVFSYRACIHFLKESPKLKKSNPATKLGGVYWNHPVRPSVCLSVRLSVHLSVDARLGKMVSSA